MTFEDAVADDAAAIADLVNRAYRAAGDDAGWTNESDLIDGPRTSEAGVAAMLGRGRIVLLRDLASNAIAACIHVAIDPDGAWHTSMLAVEPGTQMTGAGKAMKQAVERQARAAGAPCMRMEVIRQRTQLIAWHERRGYAATGTVLPFPYDDPSVGRPRQADLELIVMEKPLTA
jgi:ribosomal protein S18 acetylase RimI-like enzyme